MEKRSSIAVDIAVTPGGGSALSDTLARIGNTLVQQGRQHSLISVHKLATRDVPWIIDRLKDAALDNGCSKIFIKTPESGLYHFKSKGYTVEAMIPGFFKGAEDGYFLARYLTHSRKQDPKKDQVRQVMRKAMTMAGLGRSVAPEAGLEFRKANKSEAGELAKWYRRVVPTNFLPAFTEENLKKAMDENVRYFYLSLKDRIIAVSSAELNVDMKNVEMTGFTTDPDFRAKNLSEYLLRKMEEDVLKEGINLAYTTARSLSYPVNSIFTRGGYFYGGTLVNNANIGGSFESLNVWYKPLVKKSL